MSQYLISSKEMPFTASDIREALGLLDTIHDKMITVIIAKVVLDFEARHNTCLRRQTWAVQRVNGQPIDVFFGAISAIGSNAKIGPSYTISLNPGDLRGPYHDCSFEPDAKRLNAVKAAIVNWCWDDFSISSTILAERRGDFRPVWPSATQEQAA